MFGRCVCGHFRSRESHEWDGSAYGACRHCMVCGETSDEHVFTTHQFIRCACNRFEQAA